VLDEEARRPLLFLACDTGFAPVKSLIEHALARETAEELFLYWFTCSRTGPYLDNVCRAWADALDNFHYTPMILPCHDYTGLEAGMIPEVLASAIRDHDDLSGFDVYLAGPEVFTQTAVRLLAPHIPASQLRRYTSQSVVPA